MVCTDTQGTRAGPSAAGDPAGPEPGLLVLPAGQPVRGPLTAGSRHRSACPCGPLCVPTLFRRHRNSMSTGSGTVMGHSRGQGHTLKTTLGPFRVRCGADRNEASESRVSQKFRGGEVRSSRLSLAWSCDWAARGLWSETPWKHSRGEQGGGGRTAAWTPAECSHSAGPRRGWE